MRNLLEHRFQFLDGNRLGEVVIEPGAAGLFFVFLKSVSGDRDKVGRRVFLYRTQTLCDFLAVYVGEPDIQYDHIRLKRGD